MTSYQKDLIAELKGILADGPKNTHQIAMARGDYQAYETNLRDRLFCLAERGVLKFQETTRGRFWSFAQ